MLDKMCVNVLIKSDVRCAKGCDPGTSAGRTMTAGAHGQDGAVRHANSHVKEPAVASGSLHSLKFPLYLSYTARVRTPKATQLSVEGDPRLRAHPAAMERIRVSKVAPQTTTR
jgi:hypothetical protein